MTGPLAASDCEALSSGFLAQPVNAVSSLALVIFGGWLLMRSRSVPGRVLALALIVSGIGSFLYHGPQPRWASAVHDIGVVLVACAAAIAAIAVVAGGRGRDLIVPAAILAVAVVAQLLGRTGGALCVPASPAQAHAAWHVLAAWGLTALGDRAGRQVAV